MGGNFHPCMGGTCSHRGIFCNDEFVKQRDELAPDCKRFDEMFFGLDMAVAASPHIFACVEGMRLHRVNMRAGLGVPSLRVWFTFDDQNVTLLYIERIQ